MSREQPQHQREEMGREVGEAVVFASLITLKKEEIWAKPRVAAWRLDWTRGKSGRAAGVLTGTAYPIHDTYMIAAGIGCRQMATRNTVKRRCIRSGLLVSLPYPSLTPEKRAAGGDNAEG